MKTHTKVSIPVGWNPRTFVIFVQTTVEDGEILKD